jgi:transposase
MQPPWPGCSGPTCSPEAWIAPPEIGDLRALLGHRAGLARLATGLKDRVHAVLADRGIPAPWGRWAAPGRAWRAALELPSTPRAIIDDGGGVLDALAAPIARLEAEIAALATPDPRVQARMALPGVGKRTAMTLLAEIGAIGRSPTARKLRALAGLTPAVRNSDRTLRHGHITKQARCGCAGSCSRPPSPPSGAHCWPAPTASWPAAGAPASPPWRSPGGCWPAPSTS